jgi:hypothetical protein
MAARIRSLRNGILATAVDEASRDDLVIGDVVTVQALDAASTYNWAITFAPEGSTATFSGSTSAASPGTFTVDLEGPYLVRLIVDAGDPTENIQYVRLRALTEFGQLTLVAAGERRDTTGTIPVDVDTEGWANEQNANIQTLKNFIKPLVSSGRLLYVDANDGTVNYADYSTIQEAITAAATAGASSSEQWIVAVRPGRYIEDITFEPWVHVIGWPGNPDGTTSEAVVIEGVQTVATSASADRILIGNLHIENNADTTTATVTKSGAGTLRLFGVRVESNGTNAAQGAALELAGGDLDARESTFQHTAAGGASRVAFFQSGANTTSRFEDSRLVGPSGINTNPSSALVVGVEATFVNTRIISTHASGVGALSMAADLTIERSTIETTSGTGISINPSATVYAGPVGLTVRYTSVADDITFDTTNLAGTSTLNLGAVEYQTLNLPGGAVTSQNALAQSKTHYYDDTITALGVNNVQDAIDALAGVAVISPLTYNKNIPEVPNDSVSYRGWAPIAGELIAVRVRMMTVNTSGNYTLAVFNEATGNTCLSAATFDMNTLVAGTVQPVTLTGVGSDLLFSALDAWRITLTSDDPAFNGSDIYVELVFNTAGGGGPVVEDWATTLLVGNISGGTNPELTAGDVMVFGSSPAAPVSAANTGRLRYNQGTTSFQASVDGGAWANLGGGSAPNDNEQFEVTIFPANTINTLWFAPYNCEVVAVKVYGQTTPTTAGVYTLAVEDIDGSNNLLNAATFDLTSLTAATLTSLTLTGTAANLLLSTGTRVRFQFVSDNGDLVASGLYAQIIYRSQ